MGFNSASEVLKNTSGIIEEDTQGNESLTLIVLTWRIWLAPNNASRWQMGFNPYPANVKNMVSS